MRVVTCGKDDFGRCYPTLSPPEVHGEPPHHLLARATSRLAYLIRTLSRAQSLMPQRLPPLAAAHRPLCGGLYCFSNSILQVAEAFGLCMLPSAILNALETPKSRLPQ